MKNKITSETGDIYFHRAYGQRILETVQHYHDTYEIYFLKEGKCNYFIDDRSYEVLSGDLILIPEGVIHRTIYKEDSRCRLLINFKRALIPEKISHALTSLDYLYRNLESVKEIERIFLDIEREYECGDEISEPALICHISELLLFVLRNQDKKETVLGGAPYIEKAIKYIQKNYMHNIRLSDIAKICSVSPEHFSRTFKKETGFGFNEFLTLIRLQRAEYMLKNETGKGVGEIAFACGFNDSNYFSHKFKEAYGIPPTEIRKNK